MRLSVGRPAYAPREPHAKPQAAKEPQAAVRSSAVGNSWPVGVGQARSHWAVGRAFPAMLAEAVQDSAGQRHGVAAGLAIHARLPASANTFDEFPQLTR